MTRLLTRASVAGLSAALAAGAAITAAPAASAAAIGTNPGALTFTSSANDATFNSQDDTFSFTTAVGCPSTPTDATNFQIRISGPGLTGTPNIQGNTSQSTVGGDINSPFSGPVAQTLAGFAVAQAQPGGYLGAGTYTVELVCRTAVSGTSLGEIVGQITITGSGSTSVVTPYVPPVPTTTTDPVVTGTPVYGTNNVTLTSTVTRTSGGASVTSGSVEFREGSTVLATDSNLADGVSVTYTQPVGSKSVTAYYIAASGFEASNSGATTVTVGKGIPTNGSVAITPAGDLYSNTVLAATLTGLPSAFTGLCTFELKDSSTTVATKTASASGGSATLTGAARFGTVPAETYTVDASCAADSNYEATSVVTSPSRIVQGAAQATDLVTQQVTLSVPTGTLTLTVVGLASTDEVEGVDNAVSGSVRDAASVVTLPAAELDSLGQYLVSEGDISTVQVTDRRPGDLGYVVKGVMSDLTAGANTIDADNIGWDPAFVSFNRGTGLIEGTLVLPADGVAAGTDTSGKGLDEERVLFEAPAAGETFTAVTGSNTNTDPSVTSGSVGTAQFKAELSVKAPSYTASGSYTGTLTLSVYSK